MLDAADFEALCQGVTRWKTVSAHPHRHPSLQVAEPQNRDRALDSDVLLRHLLGARPEDNFALHKNTARTSSGLHFGAPVQAERDGERRHRCWDWRIGSHADQE